MEINTGLVKRKRAIISVAIVIIAMAITTLRHQKIFSLVSFTMIFLLLLTWKYISDLIIYFSIEKHGFPIQAKLISCERPILGSNFPSGTRFFDAIFNFTFRCAPVVEFTKNSFKYNLRVWGVFHHPIADVDEYVQLLFWDEYDDRVVFLSTESKKLYLSYCISWCVALFALLIGILYTQ